MAGGCSPAAEDRTKLAWSQAAHHLESSAEMTLIRKASDGSHFCDWGRACSELTRGYFDSPVTSVLSYAASVVLAENTSEMHRMNTDNIRDPREC